jgi:transcriptional regulator with XRE-family HTH domain
MTNDKTNPLPSSKKTSKPSDSNNDSPNKSKTKLDSWVSEDKISNFFGRVSDVTSSAFKIAKKTGDTSYKVGKAIIQSQDQLKLMVAAGQSLKDMREVAGLTVNELSDAISLKDQSILEAVENGTATLSFELILRLSALLARNDPIPFILKYSRTYSPDTWKLLHDWGAGRLPLQYQREREFINIYRSQDQARQLSDEGFNEVLEFTRQAFNMSLHFASEQEASLRNMQNNTQSTETEKSNKSQQKNETSTRDSNTAPRNKND